MQFSQGSVNATTNALGVIAGVPQIIQGAVLLSAGDYVGGLSQLMQGIGLLVGFYFIGKGSQGT